MMVQSKVSPDDGWADEHPWLAARRHLSGRNANKGGSAADDLACVLLACCCFASSERFRSGAEAKSRAGGRCVCNS